MSINHTIARRKAFVDNETAAIDAGLGVHAFLKFYTGSPPGPDNAATGTLLATVNLAVPPSFPAANSSAQAAANGVPLSATVAADGTAGYYRVIATDGTTVIHEGTVGTSAADFIFAVVVWATGGSVSVTSYTMTGPA